MKKLSTYSLLEKQELCGYKTFLHEAPEGETKSLEGLTSKTTLN